MRVLIVEDEPYMAEAIRDGLRREAIAADIAGDGDTALELLSVNAYDIAVLDRDVPGPTGDEIAGRIVASGDGMPILMLAGAVLLTVGYFSLSRGVHPGVIFLVQSHADLLRDFAPIAVAVMAFLLVFGLLGGWLLAGRMLAPLTRLTDATRMAATGSLSHRIDLAGRQDEFRELADAFDTMLARLEAHVVEQQRFAANASHELRTPLAITQTLLDVARDDPNRDTGELDERLRAVNARAIDLTEALLLLSRAPAAAEYEPRAQRDRPQPA